MKSLLKFVLYIITITSLIACSYQAAPNSVRTSSQISGETSQSSSISDLPWDINSPFGRAIELAANSLYKICNNPERSFVCFGAGLCDYNFDGIPELFLSIDPVTRGLFYDVYDVSGEEHQYLSGYCVGTSGHFLEVVQNGDSEKKYIMTQSQTSMLYDHTFITSFIDYSNGKFETYSIRSEFSISSGGRIYGPNEIITINDELIMDTTLIEQMHARWFEENWKTLYSASVEIPHEEWDMHANDDPAFAKAQVYELAKHYVQLDVGCPVPMGNKYDQYLTHYE